MIKVFSINILSFLAGKDNFICKMQQITLTLYHIPKNKSRNNNYQYLNHAPLLEICPKSEYVS